jgi:hypothetical protein
VFLTEVPNLLSSFLRKFLLKVSAKEGDGEALYVIKSYVYTVKPKSNNNFLQVSLKTVSAPPL